MTPHLYFENTMDLARLILTPAGWFHPAECSLICLDLDQCPSWQASQLVTTWPECAIVSEVCLAVVIDDRETKNQGG